MIPLGKFCVYGHFINRSQKHLGNCLTFTFAIIIHIFKHEAPISYYKCIQFQSSFTHTWQFVSVHFGPCPHASIYKLRSDSVFHIALQNHICQSNRKDMHKLCLRQRRLRGRSQLTAFETCARTVDTAAMAAVYFYYMPV